MKKNETDVKAQFVILLCRVHFCLLILLGCMSNQPATGQSPLKVALAGLSHDHVNGVMQRFAKGEVEIVGIAEPNQQLVKRYQQQFKLADSIFFKDLPSLLKRYRPDAVLAFNAISDHLSVVESCAPLGIHVMVEKPLAVTVKQAERMASLAHQYKIHVLTNYETTWYPSNQRLYAKVIDSSAIGEIRKMVVHDGHQGPKEIGVSKEFLEWLTDPKKKWCGGTGRFRVLWCQPYDLANEGTGAHCRYSGYKTYQA